ncbi:hypothetical protein [[Phormidium] sp. LEGE 05292]|uniref:hypothetical protein n=1 Tax=[Phormidium] sp. LEGE 05292 TaxID=767427 RepID=UPI002AD35358|nr:hypothetical protein [Phormidium sp. LEGE 05292]
MKITICLGILTLVEYSKDLVALMMRQFETQPKVSVESILERIFALRQINRRDQYTLMTALLSKDSLSDKDQRQINQVYEAIQKGLIRIVD